MKNKKGFTIIELITVIAILAIILGLVSVAYINITESIKTSYYKSVEETILFQGAEYFSYNDDKLINYGEQRSVTVNDLVNNKYIEKVVDRKGNDCDLSESHVGAYKDSYNKTNYYVCLICSNDNYETENEACDGNIDFSLKVKATLKDTTTLYKEGEYVNKDIILTFETYNDIREVVVEDEDGNEVGRCEAKEDSKGARSCQVDVSETGTYSFYGIGENGLETGKQEKEINIDKTKPEFDIYDKNTNLISNTEQEIYVNDASNLLNKVLNIKDIESGIETIRYTFEKASSNNNYINVEVTDSFDIEKTLEIGNYKLIVEVEDKAGNKESKTVDYIVYTKIDKPTTTLCKTELTYNGLNQVLTNSAEEGYTFKTNTGKNAGSHEVVVTLKEGYRWLDETKEDVSFNCTIEKRTLTVRAENKSKTYGASDPTLTYSYSNNVSGETPGFSGSLTRVSKETAGTYKISKGSLALTDNGTFLKDNYNMSFTEGTFTINKRKLIVTPTSGLSKYEGASDPTLTYTYSNQVSGETPGFSGSLTRESGETAGTYKITQGSLTLANNGTFLANNYEISLSSVNFTIEENDEPPVVSISIDGETYGSGYKSGAVVTLTCESTDEIETYTAKDDTGDTGSWSTNTSYKKVKKITLVSASSSREVSVSCTAVNGLSASTSKTYKIYVYSADSSCDISSYTYSGTCSCKSSATTDTVLTSASCDETVYSYGTCTKFCSSWAGLPVGTGSCSRTAVYKSCWHY